MFIDNLLGDDVVVKKLVGILLLSTFLSCIDFSVLPPPDIFFIWCS